MFIMKFLKPGFRNWVFYPNSVLSFDPKAAVFINSMAASLYIIQNQEYGINQEIKGIVPILEQRGLWSLFCKSDARES